MVHYITGLKEQVGPDVKPWPEPEKETLQIHRHTETERAAVTAMLKSKRKFHMTDRMLQFFEYGHLPDKLKEVSQPFGVLARMICETLPSNPERTVALRKLLEAKDCAVRALIYKEPNSEKPHDTSSAEARATRAEAKLGGKETINKID